MPGGGRGEHRRPLPHASCRLSPCAPYGPFHSATSHSRSRITTALTELPTSSRVAGVGSTLRPCSPQPEGAREAAKPSQEGAARGPSGACRAAARRVGVPEGGPLARTTVNVSGGNSEQQAKLLRKRAAQKASGSESEQFQKASGSESERFRERAVQRASIRASSPRKQAVQKASGSRKQAVQKASSSESGRFKEASCSESEQFRKGAVQGSTRLVA